MTQKQDHPHYHDSRLEGKNKFVMSCKRPASSGHNYSEGMILQRVNAMAEEALFLGPAGWYLLPIAPRIGLLTKSNKTQ